MTVEEVLDELRIPIAPEGHHHVSHYCYGIDCPWCSPNSSSFRLGIAKSGGFASCWVCGPHRLWNTLCEASGRPMSEVAALCRSLEGFRPGNPLLKPKKALAIPEGLGKLLSPHKKYLNGRHLDPDILQSLWGIQGFAVHSRFPWRLFIPIRIGDETVSWTTRAIVDHGLRFITAKPTEERISSRELLYGAELARSSVVVVEGPTDAWSLGPGGVATLGVGYSDTQVGLIATYPVRAICFDMEREAQKRAKKLIRLLQPFDGETYGIQLEHGKDVNSCLRSKQGRKEVSAIRSRFLVY